MKNPFDIDLLCGREGRYPVRGFVCMPKLYDETSDPAAGPAGWLQRNIVRGGGNGGRAPQGVLQTEALRLRPASDCFLDSAGAFLDEGLYCIIYIKVMCFLTRKIQVTDYW